MTGRPATESESVSASLSGQSPPFTRTGDENADLLVNERGIVWLLHNIPVTEQPLWLEHSAEDGRITLYLGKGDALTFAIPVNSILKSYLRNARKAFVIKGRL